MFLQSARYEAVSFNWWLRGAANEPPLVDGVAAHPPDLVEQDQEGACEGKKIRKAPARLKSAKAPVRLKLGKVPVRLKIRLWPLRLKIRKGNCEIKNQKCTCKF